MPQRKKKSASEIASKDGGLPADPSLLTDIRDLITAARQRTAQAVNSTLVMMYW
jgi:hypothetical protein